MILHPIVSLHQFDAPGLHPSFHRDCYHVWSMVTLDNTTIQFYQRGVFELPINTNRLQLAAFADLPARHLLPLAQTVTDKREVSPLITRPKQSVQNAM